MAQFGNDRVLFSAADFAGDGGLVVHVRAVIDWDIALYAKNAVRSVRYTEAEMAILRHVPRAGISEIGRVVERRRRDAPYLAVEWVRP
jgi:hypothetical protein